MGTAGMILIFPALMYVIAGMPVVEIILGLVGAVSLFLVLALSSTYRRARLVVLSGSFLPGPVIWGIKQYRAYSGRDRRHIRAGTGAGIFKILLSA